jgi:hypothetical protein
VPICRQYTRKGIKVKPAPLPPKDNKKEYADNKPSERPGAGGALDFLGYQNWTLQQNTRREKKPIFVPD